MLILASNSPRRKQILEMLGFDFDVKPSDCDETVCSGLTPSQIVCELAQRKACSVSHGLGDVVLGSDTVVSIDGCILGKPDSEQEAVSMLQKLSGRCHSVFTGVCVTNGCQTETLFVEAKVYFKQLDLKTIKQYVRTGEPMDKAGAYGVQGLGGKFVDKIEGDYYAVMGLPSTVTKELLMRFGLPLKNRDGNRNE
ncbi:MAG: Maf family protein [bacterium]|nr:Maf family protein [bacterium]